MVVNYLSLPPGEVILRLLVLCEWGLHLLQLIEPSRSDPMWLGLVYENSYSFFHILTLTHITFFLGTQPLYCENTKPHRKPLVGVLVDRSGYAYLWVISSLVQGRHEKKVLNNSSLLLFKSSQMSLRHCEAVLHPISWPIESLSVRKWYCFLLPVLGVSLFHSDSN